MDKIARISSMVKLLRPEKSKEVFLSKIEFDYYVRTFKIKKPWKQFNHMGYSIYLIEELWS